MDYTLDRINEMMYCELDDIAKKDRLDIKDVELIDKFVDIIKDIGEIGMSPDMGYSQMGGNSYMRGRSNRMMPMYRSDGYSRTDGKDAMLDRLQDVMDMATDEKDRRAVERLMQQMSDR